ncbi:MAG: hypothetical protein WC606_02745 [Candidatus Absconditabacterales bacterium]|jgi:hypothetical protein
METKSEITSYFAFGQHWDLLSEYVGYVPTEYTSWRTMKNEFYSSERRYGPENPFLMNIKKDNNIFLVHVYGFKLPERPTAASFETDAATRGRVVLCKIMTTKQCIAIAW